MTKRSHQPDWPHTGQLLKLVACLVLLAGTPQVALAGQGGGQADGSMTPLIVVGLSVLVIMAGIGLLYSRRKP